MKLTASTDAHPLGSDLPRGSNGFALLITIVLVAFLVLIVMTLAATTRVEIAVAASNQAQTVARQNALFGLNVALGQLQQEAGLDTRITATADLLNSTSENRDWTGVWRVSTSTGTLTAPTPTKWLVSGNNAPAAYLTSIKSDPTAIRILTAGNPAATGEYDRDVWVQRERLRSNNVPGQGTTDLTIGTYAYYVSDEGVKASLDAMPSQSMNHSYYSANAAQDRIPQLGGRAPAGFQDVATFDGFSGAVQERLARIVDRGQLELLDPANVDTAKLRQHRHDFTTQSYGLLVDTAQGRLKKDLSVNPSTELGTAITSYLNTITSTRAQAVSGARVTISEPVMNGELSYIVAPVITQFSFQAAVFNGPGESPSIASRRVNPNLETRARFFVEIWNPYTDTLVIPNGSDLRVLIRNLPEVTVKTQNTGTTPQNHGTATINFGELYNNTSTADEVALIFRPDDIVTLSSGEKAMVSGRIYSAIPPSGWASNATADLAKQTLSRWSTFARNTYWNRSSGALSGPDTPNIGMEIRLSSTEETNIELVLQIGNATDGWKDLSTVHIPPFQPFDTPWKVSTDRVPRIGFHIKMAERSSTGSNGAQWLVNSEDFRRTDYPEEMYAYAIDDEPASYTSDVPSSTSATERIDLFNRDESAPVRHYYDMALYELPRQEWVSVGSLQQLSYLNGSTPDKNYALGNSWSDTRNEWFDEYYFSTIPSGTASGTVTAELPNRHLHRVDSVLTGALPSDEDVRAAPDENAQYFMVADAFNINSTSVEAWRAVLSGMRLQNWNYARRDPTTGEVTSNDNTTLSSPFFRFSQSAGETWDVSGMPVTADINGFRRFYRQGARSLTSTQINALAEEIVDKISSTRDSLGPYASIREFLSPDAASGKNIIEQAIEAADARANTAERINYDSTLLSDIDPGSPSALSSADIMTALAPMVTPRSDTFVIRAYGASTDTLDSQATATSGNLPRAISEAWLEAKVQRVADTVDTTGGDDIVSPSPTGFGRQFKVVSFRWLKSSEL